MATLRMAPMDKLEILDVIESKIGFKPINYGTRNIHNNTVGLFLTGEVDKACEYYFIPAYRSNQKEYYLYQDKLQVFKISEELIKNYKTLAGEGKVRVDLKYKRVYFSVDDCEKIYHEDDEIKKSGEEDVSSKYGFTDPLLQPDLPGDDKDMGRLTMRDYACIELRIAESGKEWLNVLIKKSKNV